jgi:hypothetical protein
LFLVNSTVKNNNDRLGETERTVLLLKSMGATVSGNDGDGKPGFLDALEILIENLRKECYSKFAERDDFNKFRKRVEALED